MDVSSQLVPALVILTANLMSGPHSSLRYEYVSACFGWLAVLTLPLAMIGAVFWRDSSATSYLMQISGFCMLTLLSRDYEKILRPFFPWNR